MTNVPPPTFGPRGFIAPLESQILAGFQADINAAFGGNLNTALNTPQGQLASSMAAVTGNAMDTFALMANSVDPAYATGRYQDGIARIYFIERIPSSSTVVLATCSGLTGTLIPVGSLAQAADGNTYTSTADGIIGVNGTVDISFACNVQGSISCPANSLTTIYQTVLGWDSITNASDGVIGNDVENRADFENRRFQSVAHNSLGFLPSVLGAVLSVPNVVDAYVTENATGSPIIVTGVTIAARSIYVSAAGGLAADIAQALWQKKAPGCGYNGNTTVTVYDNQSGYDPPYPAYPVSFETPDPLDVLFSVNIVNGVLVPSNAATQIQSAIIAAFAGEDGGQRARIGSIIYASRFYASVAALGPWAQIVAIDIGSANTPAASIVGSISGLTLTVTSCTAATIANNQFLSGSAGGSSVAIGTQIVGQVSGSTGGTGTYTVSITQIVPSMAMATATANQNSVAVQINQVPTVSALDIVVNTS
jgi:hypothetical protein